MVPHFKHYLNYSQRNSNSKLGLKLETLSIGGDGPLVKGSMMDAYQLSKTSSCNSNDFPFLSFRFRCESSLCYGTHGSF